jgi:hypothetical protein
MGICPCCGGKYRGEGYSSLFYTEGPVCYTCRAVEDDIARVYGSSVEEDALILRQFELAQSFLSRQRTNDIPLNEWVEEMYAELVRDIFELLKSRVIGSEKSKKVEESIDRIQRVYDKR